MKQWKYKDYEEYEAEQIAANVKKIKYVWMRKQTAERIQYRYPVASSILCHGARNGTEIKYFREYYGLDTKIMGTDISPTAEDFKDMVTWDMQEPNEHWIGKWEIVYSNSFDHAMYPEKCVETWTNQVAPDGILAVELMTGGNNHCTAMDPLMISKDEFLAMTEKHGFKLVSEFFVDAKIGSSRVLLCKKI